MEGRIEDKVDKWRKELEGKREMEGRIKDKVDK